MADKKLEIEIRANVSGDEDVDKLKKGIGDLGEQATKAGKGGLEGAQGVRRLSQDAAAAAPAVDKTADAVRSMGGAADKSESQLGATRRGLVSVSTQLAETQKRMGELRDLLIAGFSFNEFVQAAAQMESVQSGLQAVAGSSEQAAEQMEFVRRMANAAGVDVAAAGQAFLGLAAATKGTAVEGEPARRVFESVTLAMAKAGKSSADTQNALLALSQIASKGTVSMEELRGQLGEALPGALQAAANGLGVTTQDLITLVENGQVAAQDLFPALAKGLDDLYGGAPAAQTLSQEITNIKNAFVEMSANIGEAGGLDALKIGAEAAQAAIVFLGDTLIQVGQYAGTVAAAVASMDFSQLKQSFDDIEAASRDRLLKAAAHNEVLRNAIAGMGTESQRAALAAQEQTLAAERAGNASVKAGTQAATAAGGVAALGAAYAKVREEVTNQVTLAEKEAEAAKARGDAMRAQAAQMQDQAEKRKLIAQAAEAEAVAVEQLAARRQTEVEVLKAELANKEAALKLAKDASPERQKELADLRTLIQQKQVDADKTLAQAVATREKAKANSEEAQASREAVEAAQALAVTRKADAQVAFQSLQTQLQLARQTEQLAIAMGDEEAARKARILQLEIEIRLVKAKADVARAEAEGTIAVAQAMLADLRVRGQLTPLKEAEINASIKLAQAKLEEAKATGQSTELLERQLEALRNGNSLTDANTNSLNKNTQARRENAEASRGAGDAIDQEYASRLRNSFAIDAENRKLKEQAERKRLNIDQDGFSLDKSGNRLTQVVENQQSVASKLKGMGLDEQTAADLASKVYDDQGNYIAKSSGAYRDGDTLDAVLARLAAQQKTGGSSVGRTVKVDINTGRGTETVNTDEAGAAALVRSLQVAGLASRG